YCKGCGKYLYNPSLLRRTDTPPDVIAWMLVFSLASFLIGIVATRSIFLPWREAPVIFAFLFAGAAFAQIFNILLGVRLRKRLTRGRRELPEQPRQKRLEDGPSVLIETNIPSVIENTTKKLEPVLRNTPS